MGMTAKDRAIDLLHCRVTEAMDAALDSYYDRKESDELHGNKVAPWRQSVEYITFIQQWCDEVAVLFELGLPVDGADFPSMEMRNSDEV